MRKLLVTAFTLAVATGAQAQSADPGGAGAQRSASQANAELLYMIEQLQREVRRLRGDLEEQQNRLDRLSQQSRSRYVDLDQRILGLTEKLDQSAQKPAGEAPAEPVSTPQPTREYRAPSAEERQRYQQIQKLIRDDKDYDSAIGALYDFIGKYPEGDLTVNAYYWLGEVYLVKPQPEQAKQAFTIVASRYADHRKAPDAGYKLGVALDRLGETEEARRRMDAVIRDYPDSDAADLAREYLASH
ncbi:tol-pal system protein YbgF [Marinobacter xestospongiae]|uniref:Cell division coordinator CpoB n=1 Tax=Marinobacter xestospongiae TaxID=994319 RepID=A0ABU3VZ87_9GAMM|nr:tol-pal system protein YbgF [Marinobacter xestospongiae]MDV2079430.1 tol-pal system protein YbgF [Marinobacter xestospongiae]